jgi:hypothetical protein
MTIRFFFFNLKKNIKSIKQAFKYTLSHFPQGRAERLKISLWAILAKEPACRVGSSFGGEGWEGGALTKYYH